MKRWLRQAESYAAAGLNGVAEAQAGSLIVLHEGLGGPPVSALADTILTGLRGRGLELVTVDTLHQRPR